MPTTTASTPVYKLAFLLNTIKPIIFSDLKPVKRLLTYGYQTGCQLGATSYRRVPITAVACHVAHATTQHGDVDDALLGAGGRGRLQVVVLTVEGGTGGGLSRNAVAGSSHHHGRVNVWSAQLWFSCKQVSYRS